MAERMYKIKREVRGNFAKQVAGEFAKRKIGFTWLHIAPLSSGGDSSLYVNGAAIKIYQGTKMIDVHAERDEVFADIEKILDGLKLERVHPELIALDGRN